MAQEKKNKSKNIRAEKKTRSTPLILPRYPKEAKKLEEVNALLENAVLLPHHSKGPILNAVKKSKQKNTGSKTKQRTTPLLLPRNEREAKELAEMNAIIENMIFLPDETEKTVAKRKR